MQVTATLVAARCTIRRSTTDPAQGDIEFAGVSKITGPNGVSLGQRDTGTIRATFAQLGGRTYPVKIGNSTVQVAGQTILDALESVYDYLRNQPPQTS